MCDNSHFCLSLFSVCFLFFPHFFHFVFANTLNFFFLQFSHLNGFDHRSNTNANDNMHTSGNENQLSKSCVTVPSFHVTSHLCQRNSFFTYELNRINFDKWIDNNF